MVELLDSFAQKTDPPPAVPIGLFTALRPLPTD
jgi:hypothetical protein